MSGFKFDGQNSFFIPDAGEVDSYLEGAQSCKLEHGHLAVPDSESKMTALTDLIIEQLNLDLANATTAFLIGWTLLLKISSQHF